MLLSFCTCGDLEFWLGSMSGWLVHPGGRPCVLKVFAQNVIKILIIDVIMIIINVIMTHIINVIMILVNVMVRSPEWEV